MSDVIKLRIKFSKTGAIRYIGHLDVMRFFQKCIRRADIDICYTGGFSPHQVMSFASPLSVGLESFGEYMDIAVNSVTDSEDMISRLNQASVPGIRIVSVKRLPDWAGNAMASVAAAEYSVSFKKDRIPAFFLQDVHTIERAFTDYLSQPEILYTKEGKKGSREVNLRAGIFELNWDIPSGSVHMLLDASSAGNIKPAQVLDAFLSRHDQSLAANALQITRLETYTRIGEGESYQFLSMDEIGKAF